ncbi:MAG: hypothetical protein U9P44_01045 [archaeon]|nr:hypothetical protein [archaeon]
MGFLKRLLGLEKVYTCEVCGETFTNRRTYVLHKANHEAMRNYEVK